ncbi:MAG: S9 family peptidase [Planctomycetes bacterium]|nr:S9 family peptidase [Planctomycetota bacterium]
MSARWKLPPDAIARLVDAPATPWVLTAPDARTLLFVEHAAAPALEDVARPKLKLAGLRIDPRTDARHQTAFGTGLVLRDRDGGRERRVELPPGRLVHGFSWSPDGARIATTLVGGEGLELAVLDVATARLAVVVERAHAVFGSGADWIHDPRTGRCDALLVSLVPRGRGAAPALDPARLGPSVQDARGEVTPLRTQADLLASPFDEELFEHHARSELGRVDLGRLEFAPHGGAPIRPAPDAVVRFDGAALHLALDSAPGGRWAIVTRAVKPFSYQMGVHGFPQELELLDLATGARHPLLGVPAAENVPIEGVRTGPRALRWHPLAPARLVWLEALDGGDPRVAAAHRDRWMELDVDECVLADARGAPLLDPRRAAGRELVRVEHRASALFWFADGERFLAREYDRERRWTRMRLHARGTVSPLAVLDDRSVHDRYGDPGGVLLVPLPSGRRVVHEEDGALLRASEGENERGARPFVDRQVLATGERSRVFESAEGEHEGLHALVREAGRAAAFLTRHESPSAPPNLRLRRFDASSFEPVTAFPDPTPELRGIRKELVRYARADGVELSGKLYLPPDWDGAALPLVIWAYPQDYVDPDTAGQVRDTPHAFTRFAGASPLAFVLRGYALLEGASMPIVGPPGTMNDTFVEQSVAYARAAIEHLAARGVADPRRVGIAGHSYGAFLTALLLANCDLFRAGIARSGAYNRTLTPFGFQSERRTLWEARDTYLALSPFLQADRIRAPLLLVHGAEDPNPGTHPLQSERLFHAIKGTGGVARLVSLPHEGHAYRARESVLHVLAEMVEWFDEHVRGGGAA